MNSPFKIGEILSEGTLLFYCFYLNKVGITSSTSQKSEVEVVNL